MKLRKVGAIRRRARGALRLGETDNEVLVLLVAAGGDAGVRLCERYSARAHELGHPFRVCAEDDIMPGTISVITLREPRPLSGEQRLAAAGFHRISFQFRWRPAKTGIRLVDWQPGVAP